MPKGLTLKELQGMKNRNAKQNARLAALKKAGGTSRAGSEKKLNPAYALGPQTQKLMEQTQTRDLGLGDFANSQLEGVRNAYSQPFDLSGIGNDPATMDFSADRSRIEKGLMDRFEAANKARYAQEDIDFDQQMANRGIPLGSELYNKMAMQKQAARADERNAQQAQTFQLGGQEEERSWNMGSGARTQAINEKLMGRNLPYQEMANILGMQQGDIQNIQLPFIQAGQNKQNALLDAQLKREAIAKSGSGGGGGGGLPGGPFGGFATPQEYANFKRQQSQLDAEAEYAFKQSHGLLPKSPSTGSQIGSFLGPIAGAFAQGFGNQYGQSFYKSPAKP